MCQILISNIEKEILMNIKKRKVLYVKLMNFTQSRAYFWPFMNALVACIRVLFSQMAKISLFICMNFYNFSLFLSLFCLFSTLLFPFLKNLRSCLHGREYTRQCYYYLYVLYNLACLHGQMYCILRSLYNKVPLLQSYRYLLVKFLVSYLH